MLDLKGWLRLTAESLTKTTFAKEKVQPHIDRLEEFVPHSRKAKFRFLELSFTREEIEGLLPEKWFLVCNELDRERQMKALDKNLTRIREALERQHDDEPHLKKICRLAAHKSLGRFLRPVATSPERYELNEDAVALARRMAGIRAYRTTMTEWSAEELHDAYQMLQKVEANHRELKTPLRLRPCYHRLDERIRAHVMLNVLALDCLRHLEDRTGYSANELRELTRPMKASLFEDGSRRWWQVVTPTKEFKDALKKAGAKPLPTTWGHWSEIV